MTVDPKLKSMQGKNIAEIAKAQGKDAIDCILDLLAEDPGMDVVVEGMSEKDVTGRPQTAVGLGRQRLVGRIAWRGFWARSILIRGDMGRFRAF